VFRSSFRAKREISLVGYLGNRGRLLVAALLVFGYVKGRFTVKKPFRSAWQTALVGGLAAAAAFAIAKAIA